MKRKDVSAENFDFGHSPVSYTSRFVRVILAQGPNNEHEQQEVAGQVLLEQESEWNEEGCVC